MDVGEPERTIVVEPLEDPVPVEEPTPAEPRPQRPPREEPAETPGP